MASVQIQSPINAQRKSGVTPERSGEKLVWNKENQAKVKTILKRYPNDRQESAVIPVLWLAQRQFGGWVSVDAMELVAETLEMPYVRVYEVATFYTMFNLKPIGKYHVQVCTNCSCLIRGSDKVVETVKEFTGIKRNKGTSEDEIFTFEEVECLGACVDAPMMQINTNYFTNLTPVRTKKILEDLKAGKNVAPDTVPTEIDPVSFTPEAPAKPNTKVKKAPAKQGAKK